MPVRDVGNGCHRYNAEQAYARKSTCTREMRSQMSIPVASLFSIDEGEGQVGCSRGVDLEP